MTESGISPQHIEAIEGPDSRSLLVQVFTSLAEGTSGQRRELRQFIGAWLDDWLHRGPTPAARDSILSDFARQGWFVHEGRLVVGPPVRGAKSAGSDIARDAGIAALHDRIRSVARRPFEAGELAAAVFETFKALSIRVKEVTGI